MLDAVRIVERGSFLSEQESADLRVWFTEYMEWLETSEMGTKEYTAANNHGLYYDVQLVAIAAFVNKPERMMWYLDRSISRMLTHFEETGEMPHEMDRPICEHYQMFTLQGWTTLSRLSESVYGRTLWDQFKNDDGASIMCRAAEFSIPYYRNRPVCKPGSDIDNIERWGPLLQDARNYCPTLAHKDSHWPAWYPLDAPEPASHPFDMVNIFYPHDGIAPFWNLGLSHADKDLPIGNIVAERDPEKHAAAAKIAEEQAIIADEAAKKRKKLQKQMEAAKKMQQASSKVKPSKTATGASAVKKPKKTVTPLQA